GSEIQGALVKAAAQDGALDPVVLDGAQGADVVQGGHPAGGDHGDAHLACQAHGGLDVDAAEHAVASDVGVDDRFAAIVLEFLRQVENVVAGELGPAIGGDLAVARVQADDDVAG